MPLYQPFSPLSKTARYDQIHEWPKSHNDPYDMQMMEKPGELTRLGTTVGRLYVVFVHLHLLVREYFVRAAADSSGHIGEWKPLDWGRSD